MCSSDLMADLIQQSKGVLDKYIGDAIMAFWGAPISVPNQADIAAETSIKMLYALDKLRIDLPKGSEVLGVLVDNKSVSPEKAGKGLPPASTREKLPPSCSTVDDAVTQCQAHQFGGGADAQLVFEQRLVVGHRLRAEVQAARDVVQLQAVGQQAEDLELARRQDIGRVLRLVHRLQRQADRKSTRLNSSH